MQQLAKTRIYTTYLFYLGRNMNLMEYLNELLKPINAIFPP